MARAAEFSKETKRAALKRSGGLCEASGKRYGLEDGQRCNAPLSKGVIFDHDDPEANSKNATLENCRAICPVCDRYKTFLIDIPMIAKTVRMQDKHNGIKRQGPALMGTKASGWRKRMNGQVERRS